MKEEGRNMKSYPLKILHGEKNFFFFFIFFLLILLAFYWVTEVINEKLHVQKKKKQKTKTKKNKKKQKKKKLPKESAPSNFGKTNKQNMKHIS